MFDPEMFGQAMGEAIRRAVEPLQAEIAELKRQLADRPDHKTEIAAAVESAMDALPKPQDGKSIDPAEIQRMVEEAVGKIPAAQDGKSVTLEDVRPMITDAAQQAAQRAVLALPVPQNGKDADMDEVRLMVDSAVKDAVSKLPAPEPGRSITLDDVMPTLRAELQAAIEAMPAPKDGKPISIEDVRPILEDAIAQSRAQVDEAVRSASTRIAEIDARIERRLAEIRQPEDGKSVTADEVYALVKPSIFEWALEFERRAQDTLQRAVESMPKPKDGVDGLGFDDMSIEYDGERSFTVRFERDGRVKEKTFTIRALIDRGVFKSGDAYETGDGVTWAGSYWIAQKTNPTGKPGEAGSDGWRLAVKRGRDGKDGRNGIDKTVPVKLEGKE